MSEVPNVPLYFALFCILKSQTPGSNYKPPSDDALRRMFPELNPPNHTDQH